MLNFSELRHHYKLLRGNPPMPIKDELQESPTTIFSAFTLGICLLLAGVLFISGCPRPAHAVELSAYEEHVIMAIIGEAENQGEIGMLAVACAIRNRGTLDGVYGLQRAMKPSTRPPWVWTMAYLAWQKSSEKDITNGATGWGNASDIKKFRMCRWWKNCVVVFRWKDHVFYKEVA